MKQKLTFLTVLFAALSAFSTEYYVDASRPDDTGVATNWVSAKKTIQAAIDLAADGSTIWVTNGTYVLSAEISVTNAITIRSVNGPEVTIVDGNGSTRCFNLHDSACLLSGFTITNGSTYYLEYGGVGGGILCDSYMPVISNCILTANYASGDWSGSYGGLYEGSIGGGMYQGTAVCCIFRDNIATVGAGMAHGIAVSCLFVGNQGEGAGMWGSCGGGGKAWGEAYNCTFVGNNSLYGAGISAVTAYNCVFSGNTGYSEGDFYDSIAYNSCSLYLEHGVNGNITNAPLFVDAANGDFRLQSNSPCINWGNNAYVTNVTDLDGNPRIVEGTVDMGAYEYQGTIGLADSDNDGINDDWERAHGGNQNPERVCSNGVNTILQAYIAGLNPNDPASRFAVSVSGQTLRWNATSGRVYAVYYSTNLLSGFEPLGTNILWPADGFTDGSPNAEQRFYRVEVRKP